jgi:hypothetical protein
LFASGEALHDLPEFSRNDIDALSELELNVIATTSKDGNDDKRDNNAGGGQRRKTGADSSNSFDTLDDALRSVVNANNEVVVIPTNAFFSPLARNQVNQRSICPFVVQTIALNKLLF